jgi:hypothetical protein
MADHPQLNGAPSPSPSRALSQRRGGRSAGTPNKRSTDLARWIAAEFGGMTPGQQSAHLCLLTAEEIAAAPGAARELGLIDLGLDVVALAMAVKAKRLAKALGCEAYEAWLLLTREREGLMKYVHPAQPPARDAGGAPAATVYIVPESDVAELAMGELPGDDQDPDFIGILEGEPGDVGSAASEGDEEP